MNVPLFFIFNPLSELLLDREVSSSDFITF